MSFFQTCRFCDVTQARGYSLSSLYEDSHYEIPGSHGGEYEHGLLAASIIRAMIPYRPDDGGSKHF
jgi:hypothetical protein